jgi:hypothetical protein
MFSKRSIASIFVIAIASSLIVVSSSFVDSVYAFVAKKIKQYQQDTNPAAVPFSGLSGLPAGLDEDESRARTSHGLNAAGWDWTIGNANSIPAKEVDMWKQECND